MKLLLLITAIMLSSCSGVERIPERNWARSWNTGTCYHDDGEQYNCTREEILAQSDRADFLRHSRTAVSLANKSARSLPVDPLEREWMIFKIALYWMNKVQYAIYNVTIHGPTLPPSYAEKVMEGVPDARVKMNVYARKLRELSARHNFSEYLLARIEDLNGNSFSSNIGVERNGWLWIFSTNPSTADHNYLLDDLRPEVDRIYREKMGGGFALIGRSIATTFLLGAGGFTGKNETVITEMETMIGLKIVFKGRYGEIKGRKPL